LVWKGGDLKGEIDLADRDLVEMNPAKADLGGTDLTGANPFEAEKVETSPSLSSYPQAERTGSRREEKVSILSLYLLQSFGPYPNRLRRVQMFAAHCVK
jgi:hypothetical protein